MTSFAVTIEGKGGLSLDGIKAVLMREAENIAVLSALPIANKAKQLVRKKTGTLGRSIHIGGHADLTPDTRIHGDIYDYGDITGPEVDPDGTVSVYIGTNLDYARIIEFGGPGRISAGAKTALAKYGGGAAGGNYRPAYPYLRPAMLDPVVRAEVVATAQTAAQLALQKAILDGGR